jgi:hypothetical protein
MSAGGAVPSSDCNIQQRFWNARWLSCAASWCGCPMWLESSVAFALYAAGIPKPGVRPPGRACQGGVRSADLRCPPHADAPPDPRDQRGDRGHPGLGRVCGHRQSHAALGRKRRRQAPVVRRHRPSCAPVHGAPGGSHPWYVKSSVCVRTHMHGLAPSGLWHCVPGRSLT